MAETSEIFYHLRDGERDEFSHAVCAHKDDQFLVTICRNVIRNDEFNRIVYARSEGKEAFANSQKSSLASHADILSNNLNLLAKVVLDRVREDLYQLRR